MAIAHSKLTAQGQISVPAEIRRKLGLAPGAVIEWDQEGERIVVRRAGRYSLEDIRKSLFPKGPPKARTLEEMDAGIAAHMRKRHARR
jgi:antitoxin PrlF